MGGRNVGIQIRKGSTRLVILTNKYAFKLPLLRFTGHHRYRNFLIGMLANMREVEFGTNGFDELCPVTFSFPLGILTVMLRAESLNENEFAAIKNNTDNMFKTVSADLVEMKIDSFGILPNGRIVAIDYG